MYNNDRFKYCYFDSIVRFVSKYVLNECCGFIRNCTNMNLEDKKRRKEDWESEEVYY